MKDPYKKQEMLRYNKPILSREAIISILQDNKRGLSLKQISKGKNEFAYSARLSAMVRDGQLVFVKDKYKSVASKVVKGYVSIRRDGLALIATDKAEYLLSNRHGFGLFAGDFISVRTTNKELKGKYKCLFVNMVARRKNPIIAEILKGKVNILPNQIIGRTEFVAKTSGYKFGDKVLVEIPNELEPKELTILKKLELHEDIRYLSAYTNGLTIDFPDKVLEYAKKLKLPSLKGRKDLRDLPFVTIDGEDAKDYDDAIFVKRLDDAWVLYVAIADVAEYVAENSILDQEAKNRATSVYFPGFVIPMLPEKLSNDLCSLLPNKDRAVLLAEMTIDNSGNVRRSRIYKAMINSKARLTYDKVTQFSLDVSLAPKFWQEPLKSLGSLCDVLASKKNKRGALLINRPEQVVKINDEGLVEKIYLKTTTIAHYWIELCMLEANENVAKFMLKNNLDCLYREHGCPKPDKFAELLELLKSYNIDYKFSKSPKPSEVQELLSKIENNDFLITLLLRSLPQATYSFSAKPHFGLAYKNYCHFTSPIRRYPDLFVHRKISMFLSHKPHKEKESGLATHCSFAERRADFAARDAVRQYCYHYLADRVGESFDGTINSIHDYGFFVELSGFMVDGLLLRKDVNCGKALNLGDKISVKIIKIDLINKKIDLIST